MLLVSISCPQSTNLKNCPKRLVSIHSLSYILLNNSNHLEIIKEFRVKLSQIKYLLQVARLIYVTQILKSSLRDRLKLMKTILNLRPQKGTQLRAVCLKSKKNLIKMEHHILISMKDKVLAKDDETTAIENQIDIAKRVHSIF